MNPRIELAARRGRITLVASLLSLVWVFSSALSAQPGESDGHREASPPVACELGAAKSRVQARLVQDDWREALEESRRCYLDHPDDPGAAALLGQALFRAGRFAETERILAPVARLEGAPPRALLTLARLRDAEGRRQESAEFLERAVTAAPDDPWLLYWAADVAPSREQRVALLERYLERSAGDDLDRIEDARGTLGVLEKLGQRQVWVSLNRPARIELPLRHVWEPDGTSVGYVIEARVGSKSKPVNLLLDTGNSGLYVIQRVARKRDFAALGEATTFGGKDRRQQVQRGVFASFALGGLQYENALVTSTRDELDPIGRFHGLLGLSPLGSYRVTLDFARKLLLLETPAAPLDGEHYWIVAGQILVQARAEGEAPGLFLFDTGAGHSLLAASYVARLEQVQVGPATGVSGLGGRYGDALVVHGAGLRFQELSGSGALATVDLSLRSRSTGVEISGYLGLEVLDGARIILDTTTQTIRASRPNR
jgi:tetratricopeptide (TPR) repeat protein